VGAGAHWRPFPGELSRVPTLLPCPGLVGELCRVLGLLEQVKEEEEAQKIKHWPW
jgi:hypothetical protein